MSVVAGLGKALGAEVFTTGARPAKGRVFTKRKWKLVMMALAVGALFAFFALIVASQTPTALCSVTGRCGRIRLWTPTRWT